MSAPEGRAGGTLRIAGAGGPSFHSSAAGSPASLSRKGLSPASPCRTSTTSPCRTSTTTNITGHQASAAASALALERQVQEQTPSFCGEFQDTATRLQKDIESCHDKFEMLVASQKVQTATALADLRCELDVEKADFLEEISQKLGTGLRRVPGTTDNHQEAAPCEPPLEAEKRQHAERQHQEGLQADGLKVELGRQAEWRRRGDLRLGGVEAADAACLEFLVRELRHDLDALREDVQLQRRACEVNLQSESSEQIQALHQVLAQSIGELGGGLEKVSRAMAAMEHKQKQQMQELHGRVEAAEQQHQAEMLEALELSSRQLMKSMLEEQVLRSTGAKALHARIDALEGQLKSLEQPAPEELVADLRGHVRQLEVSTTVILGPQTATGHVRSAANPAHPGFGDHRCLPVYTQQ